MSEPLRATPPPPGAPAHRPQRRGRAWLAHARPPRSARGIPISARLAAGRGSARPALYPFFTPARARRFFTVLDGCAPFLIHAEAFSVSILRVGGLVSGL